MATEALALAGCVGLLVFARALKRRFKGWPPEKPAATYPGPVGTPREPDPACFPYCVLDSEPAASTDHLWDAVPYLAGQKVGVADFDAAFQALQARRAIDQQRDPRFAQNAEKN